jgi:hypothetical protein
MIDSIQDCDQDMPKDLSYQGTLHKSYPSRAVGSWVCIGLRVALDVVPLVDGTQEIDVKLFTIEARRRMRVLDH